MEAITSAKGSRFMQGHGNGRRSLLVVSRLMLLLLPALPLHSEAFLGITTTRCPAVSVLTSRVSLCIAHVARSDSVSTAPSPAPSPVLTSDEQWELINRLVKEATKAGDGPDIRDDGGGYMSLGSKTADEQLIKGLSLIKDNGGLKYWNSVRLEPYRVSRSELKFYCQMPERLEKTLGFTASPAVERIENGIGVVMALTMGTAITSLDSIPGPEFVRWCATAAVFSLPFIYMSIGLSFPETLISAVNSVLFVLNRDYKERLYRHEAGHFLVGYLCGLPVLKYSVSGRLNAVQFAQSFDMGRRKPGMEVGPFTQDYVEGMTPRGLLSTQELARLVVVSLAGVVSEFIRFKKGEGGFTDLAQLLALMDLADPNMTDRKQEDTITWGTLTAYNVIRSNEKALEALMEAFERKASVVECIQIIEQTAGCYKDDD